MSNLRCSRRDLLTLLTPPLASLLFGGRTAGRAAVRAPDDENPWVVFPEQKKVKQPRWGEFLSDLEGHLPAEYGKQYQSDDLIVHAHETSHGIHAHIRNLYAVRRRRVNCFYVGHNSAAVIDEPRVKLSQVAELVPEPFRLERFKLYLIKQQKDWENESLYVFDEWVAYVNGAQAGIELEKKGYYPKDKNDSIFALLEMNVYAVYALMAVLKHDRAYNSKNLREFLAWNLKRSMFLYRDGTRLDPFNWDNHRYLRRLQSGPEAATLRHFLKSQYGDRWCGEVLGS